MCVFTSQIHFVKFYYTIAVWFFCGWFPKSNVLWCPATPISNVFATQVFYHRHTHTPFLCLMNSPRRHRQVAAYLLALKVISPRTMPGRMRHTWLWASPPVLVCQSPRPEPETWRTIECPLSCCPFLVVEQKGFNSNRGGNRLRAPLRLPDFANYINIPHWTILFFDNLFIIIFWQNNNHIFLGCSVCAEIFSEDHFRLLHLPRGISPPRQPRDVDREWVRGAVRRARRTIWHLSAYCFIIIPLLQHAFKFAKWKEGLTWVRKKVGFSHWCVSIIKKKNRGSATTLRSFIFFCTPDGPMCVVELNLNSHP